jgi:phage baseplate assembly protein W
MAYILDKKIVKDTEEFSNHAYGITLPVSRGNGGYFNQSFSSYEQAKSNLKNLLLTNKGERIFQPEFGTGLQGLLFEQADENLETDLERVVTESVNFWLPYIEIKDIEVTMSDVMKDNNRAQIKIQFSIGGQFETEEITFTVEG